MATHILVVEDDRLNRNLLCKVLRDEGHQIVEACDGAEALELLQHEHFDLAIIDFIIPKINGLKLVEHLHPDVGSVTRGKREVLAVQRIEQTPSQFSFFSVFV